MFGFFPAMPTLFQADLKLGPGTPSNRKLLSTVVHLPLNVYEERRVLMIEPLLLCRADDLDRGPDVWLN